jgi:hypothetical protein
VKGGERSGGPRRLDPPYSLAWLNEITDYGAHGYLVAGLGCAGRDTQDTAIEALDILRGFFAFESKQAIAGADGVAVVLQPADEDAFLHVPSEARDGDFDGHLSLRQ